ncbi:migration and invasion-inhibitory protein [Gastrophryne carolinensis]
MSVSDKLEELRRINKSLLDRLTRKQDEFKKQKSADSIREVQRATRASKDHLAVNDSSIAPPSVQGLSSIARKALSTPKRTRLQDPARPLSSTPCAPDKALDNQGPPYEFITTKDVIKIRSPVKRLSIPNFAFTHAPPRSPEGTSRIPGQYADHLMDEGNRRCQEPRTPKSILVTPKRSAKKDPGHVTFLSSNAESHADHWSGRPLLGYDWIAGLLETDSMFTSKPDHFFSEINEFRRVNREECVHDSLAGSEAQDSSDSEEDLDLSLDTHQCVYCYRVNSRLFTSPVGAEAACPICKKRRSRRHAALEEPAYIRVSIPRSTLLPPYKYRAHRRKSFDPTDTLALPSHCLAGWENAVPSCNLRVTSLDLKTSVDPSMVEAASSGNISTDSASFYASRARSENLLNMSRSISFHHNKDK